jgi:MFS family permease
MKASLDSSKIASLMLFFSLLGSYMITPFLQEQQRAANCDSVCVGFIQATKSGSSLIFAVLIGIFSDQYGRYIALLIGLLGSLLSYVISLQKSTSRVLLLAGIAASLNQSTALVKALYSDYAAHEQLGNIEKASLMSSIGVAASLAFMLGSYSGPLFFPSHKEVIWGSIATSALSLICLLFISTKSIQPRSLHSFGLQPLFLLNSPDTLLLLCIRLAMGVAYGVFNISFNTTLQQRFQFEPSDFANYFFFVGLVHTFSQLGLTHFILSKTKLPTRTLIISCCVIISVGRLIAMATNVLCIIYLAMFVVIVSLCLLNVLIAGACASVGGRRGISGVLFGSMEGAEKVGGTIGPIFGGILHSKNEMLPVLAMCCIYVGIGCAVFVLYDGVIGAWNNSTEKKKE